MSKDQGFFVYAMLCDGDGVSFLKIGKSRCITRRISAVQTGCPLAIHTVLKLSYPDAAAMSRAECELHARLDRYRTSGEWFSLDFDDETDADRFIVATEAVLPEGRDFWEVIPIGSQFGRGRYGRLSADPAPPRPIRPSGTKSLETFQREKRGLQPLFWSRA